MVIKASTMYSMTHSPRGLHFHCFSSSVFEPITSVPRQGVSGPFGNTPALAVLASRPIDSRAEPLTKGPGLRGFNLVAAVIWRPNQQGAWARLFWILSGHRQAALRRTNTPMPCIRHQIYAYSAWTSTISVGWRHYYVVVPRC